eukprot:s5_g40.t3
MLKSKGGQQGSGMGPKEGNGKTEPLLASGAAEPPRRRRPKEAEAKAMVTKNAVIGIDLGADTSFVGYVGKGIVDICQNEVSRRETPSLVGFTDRERLLGDSALALVKSNAKNTCWKLISERGFSSSRFRSFSGDCGGIRGMQEFWSTSEICQCPDGTVGYKVNYKGEQEEMSAIRVTAMFLTKLRDVTEKWTSNKASEVADCVIGVPSYYSDVHRQALLDAAKIAGMPVLRLMNEHTATALAYGIYRSNDFDAEKPCTVAFCNMGHTMFSVSIVQFVKGKLTVVCEKCDKVTLLASSKGDAAEHLGPSSSSTDLTLHHRRFPMQVELLFLNGQSLAVDLAVGLEEVKVKAAQVLETAPQAVSINAGGQVLTQRLLSQLQSNNQSVESCYALVDQDRLQMAEVLQGLEESLHDLRRQSELVREMRAAWKLRELELPCLQDSSCDRCIRAAERSLKEMGICAWLRWEYTGEDVLSVQEERALVLRISKLHRLKSEETALLEARRKRSGMDHQLHRKLLEERKHLRCDLQSEIQDIIDVQVDSFPQPADEPEYCTPEWVEKYIIRPQMALGSFDDETLRQFCPRLERRNVFRASKARKSAWKGSEKCAGGNTDREEPQEPAPAPRVADGKVRSRNPGRPGRPGRKERRRSRKVGCDPLSNKKAAFKLEEQVTKTKKILSANNEAQLSVECLMEDEDFGSTITRDAFLEMCQPMMDRVNAVLEGAKAAAAAAGVTVEQIDFVEMIGGASRVPWVKDYCSKAFGGKELSTTMNADESVARGCALQAAMLSPLYKVREFSVVDVTPHPVTIGWMGSAADAEAEKADEDGEHMAGAEGEYKTMTVFPRNSVMGTVKMLTFYRKGPFDLKLEYEDTTALVDGVNKFLGNYKVDLPPAADTKKIKVKAKLSLNGTFGLESAQMLEEEEYEEKVKEKKEIEVPAEEKAEGEAKPDSPKDAKPEGEASPEGEGEKKEESPKKEPEKKVEWVEVVKKKKRTKRTDIPIISSDTCGLPEKVLNKQQDQETAMQADMKEIIETDEKRNDLESYILTMRDKCSEGGQYGAFISSGDTWWRFWLQTASVMFRGTHENLPPNCQPEPQDREKLESELMKAEATNPANSFASSNKCENPYPIGATCMVAEPRMLQGPEDVMYSGLQSRSEWPGSTLAKNKDGVPIWAGDMSTFEEYVEACLMYEQTVVREKRYLCGPRCASELRGSAKRILVGKPANWLSHSNGVRVLIAALREERGHPKATGSQSTSVRGDAPAPSGTSSNGMPEEEMLTPRETNEDDESDAWRDWYRGEWGWSYDRGWYHLQPRTTMTDTSELGRNSLPEILPDYVQGWYLFMDAGLDTMERNVLQAELRGSFSVRAVEEALRKHWRRDAEKGKAFSHLTEDQEEEVSAWIGEWNEDELEAEGYSVDEINCMASEREKAIEAYTVMQGAKRTLKEARSKQHAVKMARQFYPVKNNSRGGPEGQLWKQFQKTDVNVKCFRCGGPHKVADCKEAPRSRPAANANVAEEAPFIFLAEGVKEAFHGEVSHGQLLSTQDVVAQGKAILDGGATRTIGSITALSKVCELNEKTRGTAGTMDGHYIVDELNKDRLGSCITLLWVVASVVIVMASVVQLDAAGLRNRLLVQHGETAPKGWSKMQLLLRVTELEGTESLAPKKTEVSPLRVMEVEINKAARKKATLISLIQEQLSVNLTGNETIEILKLKAMDAAYRACAAHPQDWDWVGFGQHANKKYQELFNQEPEYCKWVMPTAAEGQACPKLQRLAAWLDQQDPEDRRQMEVDSQKVNRKGNRARGSKDVAAKDTTTNQQMEQLTKVVGMLAKEVQSLKEEKESRRKTTSSGEGISSSEWETMTNPQ